LVYYTVGRNGGHRIFFVFLFFSVSRLGVMIARQNSESNIQPTDSGEARPPGLRASGPPGLRASGREKKRVVPMVVFLTA